MQLSRSSLKQYIELSKTFENSMLSESVSQGESNNVLVEESRQEIRNILTAGEHGWPTYQIFKLRKTLEIAIHCNQASIKQWQLLYEIFDSLREVDKIRPLEETEAWRNALLHAVSSVNANWFRHSLPEGSREEVVGTAILELRRRGFDARVDGQGVRLRQSELTELCARIEKKIKKVGGLQATNALLGLMDRIGRIKDGTLIHARTPQMRYNRNTRSGTPWHFIYSLSIKHLEKAASASDPSPILEGMEDYAKLLTAVINVEPHSSYENMSISRFSLGELLQETLIYDEMFAIPQWQPTAAYTLVPIWFAALEAAGCEFPIVSPIRWRTFATKLLRHSRFDRLLPVQSSNLSGEDLSFVEVGRLLDNCTLPSKSINANYSSPVSTSARNSVYYPVLPSVNGSRYVQPTSIAARALCERLYSLMRDAKVHDLENKMGKALEIITVNILEAAGHVVAVHGGKYPNPAGGNDLEVDIVVETSERIFLFECKKKPLTNASRRGETVSALNDLEKSFIYLLQQLAKHEAVLVSRGEIQFRNGYILRLNNRPVEKFCISLFDHGSLQHRDMTIALIEALIGSQITINSPGAADVQAAVNRRLRLLEESLGVIIGEGGDAGGNRRHQFAMSTWWLSVDQLQYALSKGGDIWSSLESIRHLTRRSGDMIYEINSTLQLNEISEAMLRLNKQMDNRSLI